MYVSTFQIVPDGLLGDLRHHRHIGHAGAPLIFLLLHLACGQRKNCFTLCFELWVYK